MAVSGHLCMIAPLLLDCLSFIFASCSFFCSSTLLLLLSFLLFIRLANAFIFRACFWSFLLSLFVLVRPLLFGFDGSSAASYSCSLEWDDEQLLMDMFTKLSSCSPIELNEMSALLSCSSSSAHALLVCATCESHS